MVIFPECNPTKVKTMVILPECNPTKVNTMVILPADNPIKDKTMVIYLKVILALISAGVCLRVIFWKLAVPRPNSTHWLYLPLARM